MNRKPYETPEMVVYGDVEVLTNQGSLQNADLPAGASGSALTPTV
jgi:hypothetical protein